MQISLYNLLMHYATERELEICHDLPHGNILDYTDASFLSLILAVASANQDLIEQLTGDSPLYATPNSTKLLNFTDGEASVRLLRVIDNIFTLEEKVWLRKIGGNVTLANSEDQYFTGQMATKILVKLLYQQKQLNELIRSLKKEMKEKWKKYCYSLV
jgi:streptomycin 6-kinase